MPDKDQFTFDDEDDFRETAKENQEGTPESDTDRIDIMFDTEDDEPETSLDELNATPESETSGDQDLFNSDLSVAFSDDEQAAEVPVEEEPAPKVKGDGNSRTRLLLLILLLVVIGGGGAYYFMDLGGSTPSVPTVQIPAEKPVKAVALPPQPAKTPAAQPAPEKAQPVTVAVPPPPVPAAAKVEAQPVSAGKPVAATQAVPEQKTAVTTVAMQPPTVPAQTVAAKVASPASQPEPAPQPTVSVETKPAPAPAAQVVAKVPQPIPRTTKPAKEVADGAYALDAGSYLFESSREDVVTKIKKLGYEPLVTPVDATLAMTRLRLGTYSKDDVQEALAFARSIEPGAYSAPAGDGYVIYAGTFLQSRNVEKLKERFHAEGVKVNAEPVQVVRTLSRIRFGRFANEADAAVAASEVAGAGLKAVVVKNK